MPEKAVLMPEFVFLLLDGFTMQAFSSSVEVLRVANKLQPDTPIVFHAVSMDGDPVSASNGIRLMPDLALDDISRDQTIGVVAGPVRRRRIRRCCWPSCDGGPGRGTGFGGYRQVWCTLSGQV